MRYFTYRRAALAVKKAWQQIRFKAGRGYWLSGNPPKPPAELTMFDSVSVKQIPANAQAVAGYVGGWWPTFKTLEKSFPNAHRLSIAVASSEDAECLDVERGDAAIPDAAPWVKRQLRRGVARPVVYTSVSQAEALVAALAKAGVKRDQIRLWTAHYTYKQHRCSSSCGFGFTGQADATQYTDHAFGRNLDASLVGPDFFAPAV